MAKESKNSLFNIEKEDKNFKKKRKKKNTKKKEQSDKFSFDNEIIIGVTKVEEEPKKKKKKSEPKKIKNKKTKTKTKTKNIKEEKEQKKVKEKKVKKEKKKKEAKKKPKNKKEKVEEIFSEEELELRREERKIKLKRKLRIMKYVMIVMAIIAVVLIIMFSPLFNIKEIIVENNEIVSKEQILSLSQINLDTNTFKLNKSKISKQLKENPYIEEVTISRKLPSTVILDVKERKPAYLIEYANGYVCIDQKGYILSIGEEKKQLPILQGIETPNEKFVIGNKLETKDLKRVYIVSKISEVAASTSIGALISRIDVENINSIKMVLESKEKTVYIGNDTNLNIKMLTIEQILEKTEGLAGEIFVDKDLNSEYPVFRERV